MLYFTIIYVISAVIVQVGVTSIHKSREVDEIKGKIANLINDEKINGRYFDKMTDFSFKKYLGRLLLRRDIIRKRKRSIEVKKNEYESVFSQKMKQYHDQLQNEKFQRANLPPIPELCKKNISSDENVPTDRLLAIRHSLRNYLSRINSWKKKNRCRRSEEDNNNADPVPDEFEVKPKPPLMCVPFIREGQDTILKQLIHKLQNMLHRRSRSRTTTTTEKIEIFGQIKYKPKKKKKLKEKDRDKDKDKEKDRDKEKEKDKEKDRDKDKDKEKDKTMTMTKKKKKTSTSTTTETFPSIIRFDPLTPPPFEYPKFEPLPIPPLPETFLPLPAPDPYPITFPPWPTKPEAPKTDSEPPIIYCPDKTESAVEPPKIPEIPEETTKTTSTTTTTTTTTTTPSPPSEDCDDECEVLHASDEDIFKEIKVVPTLPPLPTEEPCPEDSNSDEEVLYDYDILVETTPCIHHKPKHKKPKCKKKKKHSRSRRQTFGGNNHNALKMVVKNAEPNSTTEVPTTEPTTVLDEPTTMKPAGIVKPPKKSNAKPVPKIFLRIYPSSMAIDDNNRTSGNASTVTSDNEKTITEPPAPEPQVETTTPETPSNTHLKLLAVCESYLEVIKLVKSRNQSFGEELDSELIRYCENIISQSFNPSDNATNFIPNRKRSAYRREKQLHNKVLVDILRSPAYRKHHQLKVPPKKTSPQAKKVSKTRDLIHLLRRRKNLLLAKYHDLIKKDQKPSANIMHKTRINNIDRNKISYPTYASQYGYNKGGKVREIEVLWRQPDEKNRKIIKNRTVLALMPYNQESFDGNDDVKLAEDDDDEDEMINNSSLNNGKVNGESQESDNKTDSETTTKSNNITTKIPTEGTNKPTEKKVTIISKPDPSSILGNPPPEKKTQSNKIAFAKEIFQEYLIEFLNYAVYIIPIMFLSLFVICCLCCFIKMFATKKKKKKRKKNRKFSDDTSESSTATESKPRDKRLESLEKKIDNISKLLAEKQFESRNSIANDEEISKPSKKKKLLRFLNKKKLRKSNNANYIPLEKSGNSENEFVEVTDSDVATSDSEGKKDEAKERKELISLLKKLDQINESDNKKPVIVQYVTEATSPCLMSDEEPDEKFLCKKPPDVFERFRCISEDMTKELIKGSPNDTANKFNLLGEVFQRFPPSNLSPRKKVSLMGEMENFKRLLNRRRFVRLSDSGVLCRL